MNRLRYTQPRDYTKLKRLWKLLLKPREALDFTHYHTHRLFDGLISEKGIVDYLIQLDAQLARTYDFVYMSIEKGTTLLLKKGPPCSSNRSYSSPSCNVFFQ